MTREEAKKMLPIIQAFAEGKEIEFRSKGFDEEWKKVNEIPGLSYSSFDYRIKPESKYRPFKDVEECWQEIQKHQPFGWVREKKRNVYTQIGFMHTEGIQGTSGGSSNYKAFFDCFSFADGAPFGILEEE